MHKSQGFGAPERRGQILNTFVLRAGTPFTTDLFDGVDLSWSRVPGGDKVGALLAQAERAYDPGHPAAIVPLLLEAHRAMAALPSDPLVERRRRDLLDVIRSCTGLWVEAIAAAPAVTPGATIPVAVTVINRSDVAMTLDRIELPHGAVARLQPRTRADSLNPVEARGRALESNQPLTAQAVIALPRDQALTAPYWLARPALAGSFVVEPESLIGRPENAPALTARVRLDVAGTPLVVDVPVAYRWVDPVQGERYRMLDVVPPVSLRFDQGVYLFADRKPRELAVRVQNGARPLRGATRLRLPEGWRATPAEARLELAANDEQVVRFMVTPGAGPAATSVSAEIDTGGAVYSRRLVRIDYPHIPVQTLMPPAEARLVRVDLQHAGEQVAYVMGSGDQGPDALRQMGYRVTLLADDELESAPLARFDAIVIGVRAYNTRPRLRALKSRLLDYVAVGGRLVVQYQTPDDALREAIGPWPFTISRDRVTVETAEMRVLKPGHPLLTTPNRIGPEDFTGWVQERGLSYANPWDPRYETVLSANDPREPPRDGGLLVARVGKGTFVYTGLAMFRQLPAGVPGAWRLFANLVSAGRGS
jgi:hypothetical protein